MSRLLSLKVAIDWDWQFFAILPALNINLHSDSLEFEWLWFAMYIDFVYVKIFTIKWWNKR